MKDFEHEWKVGDRVAYELCSPSAVLPVPRYSLSPAGMSDQGESGIYRFAKIQTINQRNNFINLDLGWLIDIDQLKRNPDTFVWAPEFEEIEVGDIIHIYGDYHEVVEIKYNQTFCCNSLYDKNNFCILHDNQFDTPKLYFDDYKLRVLKQNNQSESMSTKVCNCKHLFTFGHDQDCPYYNPNSIENQYKKWLT